MSTEFDPIHGRTQKSFFEFRTRAFYEPANLYLTSFSLGKDRGTGVQLTIGDSFIQLDKEGAQKLTETLREIFR